MKLKGKRALGIGAAIAQAFAENGVDVAITCQKSAERADSVVASIEKLGRRGVAVQVDCADPHLRDGGRIISVGSALADRVPFPGGTACAMSKSALLSLTRGLSSELGGQGITVNLVLPGSTDTESNPADGESADFQRSLSSVGRYVNKGGLPMPWCYLRVLLPAW